MFRENNIGVLMLNGCGLKYSNFQILTMESSKFEQDGTVCYLQSNSSQI